MHRKGGFSVNVQSRKMDSFLSVYFLFEANNFKNV